MEDTFCAKPNFVTVWVILAYEWLRSQGPAGLSVEVCIIFLHLPIGNLLNLSWRDRLADLWMLFQLKGQRDFSNAHSGCQVSRPKRNGLRGLFPSDIYSLPIFRGHEYTRPELNTETTG